MILLSKLLADDNIGRQSFKDYVPALGFHLMKRENADVLRSWRNQQTKDEVKKRIPAEANEKALADMTGALLSNLFREELLKRDWFVEFLLRISRDLLSDRGYDEAVLEQLLPLTTNKANLIMVAGCQGEEILAARVRAAAAICAELLNGRQEIRVVLSGSCPGGKAKIRDESVRMTAIFQQEIKTKRLDSTKLMKAVVQAEPASRTTEENVAYFAKMVARDLKQPCNVFLISSTFHVNRVCATPEKALLAASLRRSHRVDRTIAVGSEPIQPNRVSMDPAYVRSMAFECVRAMFHRNEFWPEHAKSS